LTNFFLGLARGPIDHNASSVINVIANGAITMGSALKLTDTTPTAELLPRVEEIADGLTEDTYGIAVGGDTDGIYGTGAAATDDLTRATASAGQGVVVVTQGRCLARVESTAEILIGSKLSSNDIGTETGVLKLAVPTGFVIAVALQAVPAGAGLQIIAVDVQREGVLT